MRPRLYRHEKGKNKQGSRARGGEERAIAEALRRLKKLTKRTQPKTRKIDFELPLFSRAFLILIHWQQQEIKSYVFNRPQRY